MNTNQTAGFLYNWDFAAHCGGPVRQITDPASILLKHSFCNLGVRAYSPGHVDQNAVVK